MTTTILSGPSTTAVSLTTGDVYMVTPSGALVVSGSAVTATSYGATILINGSVYGSSSAISGSIGQNPNTIGSENIFIGFGANVSAGSQAIALSGSFGAAITNNGAISGFASAVFVSTGLALSTSSAAVENTGTITGGYAIQVTNSNLSAFNNFSVNNSGTISGQYLGIYAFLSSASATSLAVFSLTNNGLISGQTAILGGPEPDSIINAGQITGAVTLGSGADVYNGAFGRVSGPVSGGQGDDVLTGGAGAETFYGDNASGDTTGGADTLTGGYGDDVLNGGYGADTLYGNQDNDVLYGNQDNDWLHGGQGDDILYGGQGNDTLNGGKGDDVIYGNAGDDLFVFTSQGFGHDVVGDFRAAGANDIIQFTTDIFSDFAAVQAHAAAVSNGTLLTDAAGDTVLLLGISPGALTAAMFAFG